MTRIGAPLLIAVLALVGAGCGTKSAAVNSSTTVATSPSGTTAAGTVSFDVRFRRLQQQLTHSLKQIESGNAANVVSGGTLLTNCSNTVTTQLGARAKTASQQRQVSQLRTACADVAEAATKLAKGDAADAGRLAKTALKEVQQASK